MEDVDSLIMDIDSGDTKNPLAVTEYIDDIYTYYKKAEVFSLFLLLHYFRFKYSYTV